jgi:hypothetical protein
MCIKHIRLQAFQRLMGSDFTPCKDLTLWSLPTSILDLAKLQLTRLLLECLPIFNALPCLMASYKLHKNKYKWLTNAFQTVFSNLAILLTLTSTVILESIKLWARSIERRIKNFLHVDTSLYWIIDSIMDATLNFPEKIHDIFVADIFRCYESIPLQGSDNLIQAVTFIINLAFKQASAQHPRATIQMWVRIASTGLPAVAKWATSRPSTANWFLVDIQRLLQLHEWLMSNCYVMFGDRVWKQSTGIPMGFSCSPIWYNMYLLSYEIKFIQHLARLGRKDLLLKFQTPFRYIDDLCLINVQNP